MGKKRKNKKKKVARPAGPVSPPQDTCAELLGQPLGQLSQQSPAPEREETERGEEQELVRRAELGLGRAELS